MGDIESEYEMTDDLINVEHVRKTHIRFRTINDYEACNNAMDVDYDSEERFSLELFVN